MIGIKFAPAVVPFPPKPGYWIRLSFKDNCLVQGVILWFRGEEIIDLSNGSVATPEIIQEGDRRSGADGILVTYTEILGISLGKKPAALADGQLPVDRPPKSA